MVKKFKSTFALTAILMVTVLLAGCIGGGTKTFTLTVNVDPEGAAEVKDLAKKYDKDTIAEFALEAAEGYEFVEWTGEVKPVEKDGKWTILMDGDKTLTAVFKEIEEEPVDPEPVADEEAAAAVDAQIMALDKEVGLVQYKIDVAAARAAYEALNAETKALVTKLVLLEVHEDQLDELLYGEVTEFVIAEKVMDGIDLTADVLEDITLGSSFTYDGTVYQVTWESDKPEIIGADGTVNRPYGEDVEVTLTATLDFISTLSADQKNVFEIKLNVVGIRFDLAVENGSVTATLNDLTGLDAVTADDFAITFAIADEAVEAEDLKVEYKDGVATWTFTPFERGLEDYKVDIAVTFGEFEEKDSLEFVGLAVIVETITHYGVTVTFPEVTEAIEDANVVVKDGEGNVIETKPMFLAEGATQADFEFVTPFAEDYEFTGVWTVNGKEYSFDAINQLAAIAAAVEDGNEVKLQAALDAAGITYEDETKMPEYLSALGEEGATESLEAVQKAISEIDENAAELGNKEAAVKAVAGAKTQAQLLAALEANFKLVNPDWIVQYDEGINISTTEGLRDFEKAFNDIQKEIYAVNTTEVAQEVEAAFMSLDSEKVAKARILVTNWIPAGEEDEVTIKDWALDGLALEDALIAVNNAKTNSALKAALINLDNLENELLKKYEDVTIDGVTTTRTDDFDIETVKDENLTAYRTEIGKAELKNKNQRSDIQAIITQVNEGAAEQAKADVLAALNEVDAKTAAADVVALLEQNQKLNELDNKVNPAYAEAYKTAVLEAIAEATEDDDAFSNANAVDTLVGTVNDAEDAAALLAAVNTATTPADMSKALVALEAGQESAATDFTNLSSQEKLEVAEIVIALRNAMEGKKFADSNAALGAVTTKNTGAIAVRSAFIDGVNTATDIASMRTALNNEDLFPEFFALDVTEKTEKAELVYNALLALRADDEGEEVSNFETIAEIKEAAGL